MVIIIISFLYTCQLEVPKILGLFYPLSTKRKLKKKQIKEGREKDIRPQVIFEVFPKVLFCICYFM